jgi:hypothetical protein
VQPELGIPEPLSAALVGPVPVGKFPIGAMSTWASITGIRKGPDSGCWTALFPWRGASTRPPCFRPRCHQQPPNWLLFSPNFLPGSAIDNTYSWRSLRSNSEGVIYRGNTSDLQQFLPYGRQDLHITICGNFGFYLGVRIRSALVPDLHCTAMEKRCEMTTLLIVLLVLFVLGGGGWGYSRWRG